MRWVRACASSVAVLACQILISCGGTATPAEPTPSSRETFRLTVAASGSGTGTVTSNPVGINCGTTCTGAFQSNTQITLKATAASGDAFAGWSGACTGTGTCTVNLNADSSVNATFNAPAPPSQLTVILFGPGTGTVTSSPAGINCGASCAASFPANSQVALTATPDGSSNSTFTGWGGACRGSSTCTVSIGASNSVTATFGGSLQSIKHIVFMLQENRSFDHYYGALRQYWAANGFPDQPFDGLPQFNPTGGNVPTNPGCDLAFPFIPGATPIQDCVHDSNSPQIDSFHLVTQCVENPSPSWNEDHVDWNLNDPYFATPTLDGYVHTAAQDARHDIPPLNDTNGVRAMGYYDSGDLPFYYFMASSFATSDRWFSPVMTRTPPNRMYMMAATSAGHVYSTNAPQTNKTIFELLNNNSISWKIYVTDDTPPLTNHGELGGYEFGSSHPGNFVSAKQFFTDVGNDTLPAVAEIDPGFSNGTDEHAEQNPTYPSGKIQLGAQYVAQLINALMQSPSWKDTVFILTYDEFGGFYDHVPPQPTVSPDGIPPSDLKPPDTNGNGGDICAGTKTGPTCDFVYTGYRVPMIVISPFTKKNYVSHTVADYTAILKFIETRFNLPSLTQRDAAQMDMSEFFDFTNAPWLTPPTPPAQPNNLPCEYTTLGN
jgi:phospholipase C